jgi:flagellar motility protein MotE (MotC chaperone)
MRGEPEICSEMNAEQQLISTNLQSVTRIIMKSVSSILSAAAFAAILAAPAIAGPVGVTRSYTSSRPDPTVIAELQDASEQALREARNNKNNPEFLRKNYEIDQLIERMKSGQRVEPAELDKALEPAHVW